MAGRKGELGASVMRRRKGELGATLMRWAPTALAIVALAAALPALASPTPAFVFDGEEPRDYLGFSVAAVGDVNDDGFDDVVVGAITADPGGRVDAGSVALRSGKDGALLHLFEGQFAGDRMGIAVDAAGDVDADGTPDIVIGAQHFDGNGLPDTGATYVFSGADYSRLYRFDGDQAGMLFGDAVGGAGDVNDDGHADIVAGAPFYDVGELRDAGAAFVYSGADGSLLHQFDGQAVIEGIGWDVDGVGDIDGDDHDDILVTAPHTDEQNFRNSGSAWVYSGRTGAVIWRHNGTNALDYFGFAGAGVGDATGDGIPDVVVGAPTADPGDNEAAGSVYLLSGVNGSIVRVFHGAEAFLYTGNRIGGVGDMDGDGLMDFVASAPHADPDGESQAGSAYVFSGATGQVILRVDGEKQGNMAGWGVDGAGDVNGDGYGDLIVGLPNHFTESGMVRRGGRAVVVLAQCVDEDGDGWGMAGAPLCTQGNDCDDDNAGVNPGATEIPDNGLDDDCDPLTPDESGGGCRPNSVVAGGAPVGALPVLAGLAVLGLSRRRRHRG